MTPHRICVTALLFWILTQGVAQTSDTAQARQDSIMLLRLQRAAAQLQQAKEQQLKDSLRREALMLEMQQLQGNETFRRRQLEQEIRTLQTADSLRIAEKRQHIEALRATVRGFAVAPFGDTLFLLYTKTGSFAPRERAARIGEKIYSLYKSGLFQKDSLYVVKDEFTCDIMYKESVLMSISEVEALWHDSDQYTLAEEFKTSIGNAIVAEMQENSVRNNLIRAGQVILVLFIIWTLLWLLNRVFLRSKKYLMQHKERFVRSVRIQNYQLLSVEQVLSAVLWLNNALKIVLFLLLLYLALPVLFSIFPATHGFAGVLISWILNPVRSIITSAIAYLPNLFTIGVIFITTRYVIRVVRYLAGEIEKGKLSLSGFEPDWAWPTFNIVRFLLYAFMFVLIFPYLPGSNSPIFQGVSVFLGVLLSLGSSSTIGNMIAGLVLTYMKPFNLGDRIMVGEVKGDVTNNKKAESLLKLEKELIISLEQYPVILEQSVAEHNPSVIAIYVFNLAKMFNTFYAEHSVLNAETEEKKKLRLEIAALTANVIASGMGLLGIKVPERM